MGFAKGESGNPAGRPPGIVDRRTGFGKHCDAARASRILERVLTMAEAGDIEALKLVVPRLAPMLKPVAVQTPIAVDPTLPPDRQVPGILAQLAAGELAIEDAVALIRALQHQGDIDKVGALADAVAGLLVRAGHPLPPELRLRALSAVEKQPQPVASAGEAEEPSAA